MKKINTIILCIVVLFTSVFSVSATGIAVSPVQSASPEAMQAASYTLQDSTLYGTWSNSYAQYNCYAYALGYTDSFYNPGKISHGNNSYYFPGMNIDAVKDLVKADLEALGNNVIVSTTKPSQLPDQYYKIIALRIAPWKDFHFMRPLDCSNLNVWVHKPSGTQPLKWNYTSPSAKNWTNERYHPDLGFMAPTTIYYGTIYYFTYKATTDPGIQPWQLGDEWV